MEHQQLPAVTSSSLAKEAHSAKFQRSVLVQFEVMSCKLYSVGSRDELPVVHIFNISQYIVCFY